MCFMYIIDKSNLFYSWNIAHDFCAVLDHWKDKNHILIIMKDQACQMTPPTYLDLE